MSNCFDCCTFLRCCCIHGFGCKVFDSFLNFSCNYYWITVIVVVTSISSFVACCFGYQSFGFVVVYIIHLLLGIDYVGNFVGSFVVAFVKLDWNSIVVVVRIIVLEQKQQFVVWMLKLVGWKFQLLFSSGLMVVQIMGWKRVLEYLVWMLGHSHLVSQLILLVSRMQLRSFLVYRLKHLSSLYYIGI